MNWLPAVANAVWMAWCTALLIAMIGWTACQVQDVAWVERMWRAATRVHQELWLFVPPGILYGTLHDWHSASPWKIVIDAWCLYGWWVLRDWPEDENRWTKRGRKARSAVSRIGARLVVVPAGSGS